MYFRPLSRAALRQAQVVVVVVPATFVIRIAVEYLLSTGDGHVERSAANASSRESLDCCPVKNMWR